MPTDMTARSASCNSILRCCSDGLELSCLNGGIVLVAFVLDCHDGGALRQDEPGHDGELRREPLRQTWSSPLRAVGQRQRGDPTRPQRPSILPSRSTMIPALLRWKAQSVTASPRPSCRRSSATMSACSRSQTPKPPSRHSASGWTTTTTPTRTAGSDTALLGCTSGSCHNQSRVLYVGVYYIVDILSAPIFETTNRLLL